MGGPIGMIRNLIRTSTSPYAPALTLVLTTFWLLYGFHQSPMAAVVGSLALYQLFSLHRRL